MQRRSLASLVVRNRARRPIRVYADWTDKITMGHSRGGAEEAEEDVTLEFDGLSFTEADIEKELVITVPRRITSIDVQSQGAVVLAAKDRLEVKTHLYVTSEEGAVQADCSIRASAIEFTSNRNKVVVNRAIEAVLVCLAGHGDVVARKRVSAVADLLCTSETGEVDVASMYSVGASRIVALQGHVTLGPVHGRQVRVQCARGNVHVGSLSGSCDIEAPQGSVSVHFDSSTCDVAAASAKDDDGGNVSRSVIACGKQATVTLSRDALPMRIWGLSPPPIATEAEDVTFLPHKDGGFVMAQTTGDGEVVAELRVTAGEEPSTVRLQSWIDNVLKKFNLPE